MIISNQPFFSMFVHTGSTQASKWKRDSSFPISHGGDANITCLAYPNCQPTGTSNVSLVGMHPIILFIQTHDDYNTWSPPQTMHNANYRI